MPDPESDGGVTETATLETSESTSETVEATSETGTTAETTTTQGSEESFFDPSSLPPELEPAYKQMQGHFTKRMQSLKADKDKIDAYNAFQANPRETIKQLAGQYGLSLAEATQVAAQEFEPQDWNDVTSHIQDKVVSTVLEKLGPVFNEIQGVKQNHIEQQLDATMPEWREYEDDMKDIMARHPTLADDPVALARMAIPEHVQQSKATQAALRKLEAKAKQAAATKGTEVTQGAESSKPPRGASFNDYVAWAKKQVATS